MNLIENLKAKAEADRLRGEQEWLPLAERVAAGTANEKDIAAVLKLTGKTLDDLQVTVDRVHEIERLKALSDEFRERSLAVYKHNHETAKHRVFVLKTERELESEGNRLCSVGWQLGLQANESREAFAQLSQMTGVLHPVPKLEAEYRKMDSDFSAEVVANAVTVPATSEVELPSV